MIRWTAEQLRPEDEQLLASWPPTARLEIPGLGGVLFCHATPRNDTEIFTRTTSAERLGPVFAGVNAAVVVCGHSHMQFDRTIGSVRVVNAGSVGMPFQQPQRGVLAPARSRRSASAHRLRLRADRRTDSNDRISTGRGLRRTLRADPSVGSRDDRPVRPRRAQIKPLVLSLQNFRLQTSDFLTLYSAPVYESLRTFGVRLHTEVANVRSSLGRIPAGSARDSDSVPRVRTDTVR